jgi:peptidoglycan/LPS O-acetylase OafA/YrhL
MNAETTIRHRVEAPARSGKLLSVQVMRGVAALLVVFHHTGLILAKPEYGHIDVFTAAWSKGWIGVNFFFVLSGFIIFYAHHDDIDAPGRARDYLWRRFVRLYPTYWIFLLAFACAAALGLGHTDFRHEPTDFAAAFSLIQLNPVPSVPLKVAWTLFYEVRFYLLFLALILNRKAGTLLFAGWLAGILFANFVRHDYAMGWSCAWNLNFFVGAGVFYLHTRLGKRWGWPSLAIGLVLIFAMLARGLILDRPDFAQIMPMTMILMSVAFGMILLGGCIIERERTWQAPYPLVFLGEASYSIYLVHSAAISLIAQIHWTFARGSIVPPLLFILTASGATAAGSIAHLIVERPLLRALHRLKPGTRRSARYAS